MNYYLLCAIALSAALIAYFRPVPPSRPLEKTDPGIYGIYIDEADRFVVSHLHRREWDFDSRFVVAKGRLSFVEGEVVVVPWEVNCTSPASKESLSPGVWKKASAGDEKDGELLEKAFVAIFGRIGLSGRFKDFPDKTIAPSRAVLVVPDHVSKVKRTWITELASKAIGLNVTPIKLSDCLRDIDEDCAMTQHPSIVFNCDGSAFLFSKAYPSTEQPNEREQCHDLRSSHAPTAETLSNVEGYKAMPIIEEIFAIDYPLEDIIHKGPYHIPGESETKKLDDASMDLLVEHYLPRIRHIDPDVIPSRGVVVAGAMMQDLPYAWGGSFVRWAHNPFTKPPIAAAVRLEKPAFCPDTAILGTSTIAEFPTAYQRSGSLLAMELLTTSQSGTTTVDFYSPPGWETAERWVGFSWPPERNRFRGSITLDGMASVDQDGKVLVWFDGTWVHILDMRTRRRARKNMKEALGR